VTLPEPSHGVAKPNGGTGSLLPIIDVAVTGIGRVVQTLPGLFAIYWLPWLLGTVVLVILEIVIQDQLRLGRAPDWAREILWAPFMAMTYLMLLRWVLDGEPPARAINFEVGRKTRVATPIVAAWFVANVTVSDAPMPMMRWLVLPSDVLAYPMGRCHALLLRLSLRRLARERCPLGLLFWLDRRGGQAWLARSARAFPPLAAATRASTLYLCVGGSGCWRPLEPWLASPRVARRRPAGAEHNDPVAGQRPLGVCSPSFQRRS